jgi:EAL domain-containing protein (putative c-di-GMP-specific phosphodiesterase class I)
MGPDAADLRLAVNVSDRQLLEPGFAEVVRDALRDSDLPARLLTIELTESRLVDEAAARSQLRAAAELGVRIAIDDFGSGYASLTSLRSFPVHQLKVDRRLLLQDDEERGHAIFQLVISVGQILDLELVAERVEAPEQATLVRHAGLWLAQGDLFAPPMAAEDFPEWLSGAAAGPHLAASA